MTHCRSRGFGKDCTWGKGIEREGTAAACTGEPKVLMSSSAPTRGAAPRRPLVVPFLAGPPSHTRHAKNPRSGSISSHPPPRSLPWAAPISDPAPTVSNRGAGMAETGGEGRHSLLRVLDFDFPVSFSAASPGPADFRLRLEPGFTTASLFLGTET
ncbi:hypothetical protein T484DRAFT_2309450 [Baffinella frigidus]|nr:hypothetical protein T484DRAFT_2309450 [Cryptophyta sp. CCMP2293]